jgi:TonB-dependent receptor
MFWRNRLRLTGGVRYEYTDVVARGTLTNLQLQYRRDANGNILDGNPAQAGVQPIALTTDTLEVAKLTRLPLANRINPTYGDLYPSVNATLTLRENLLLRLGYAHTIGRPTLGQLIPSTSVAEVLAPVENATGSGLGTITTSNPELRPWSGRNHDVAIEYYTKAGGLFSVSVYRRDVTDFITTVDSIATAAELADLGLPEDYEGFLLRHPENTAGSVRQTGIELSARQRLRPWLSVFSNYTRNRTIGSQAGNFANSQSRRFNAGVQFAYKAFSMTTNYNWTGQRRGGTSTIAPGAYGYTRPRTLLNVSAEYLVRRNVSVYATVSNLLNNPVANETYGADTPAYARLTSERKDGSQIQFGLKGSF